MTIIERIDKWLSDINQDLAKARPQDKWVNQTITEVKATDKGYSGAIYTNNYVYWLDRGRGPTSANKKGRLYGVIKQWVQEKGITSTDISQNSLAFLIARKIDREGYKGKDFLKDILTSNRIEVLNKDLTVLYVDQIRSNIMKQW